MTARAPTQRKKQALKKSKTVLVHSHLNTSSHTVVLVGVTAPVPFDTNLLSLGGWESRAKSIKAAAFTRRKRPAVAHFKTRPKTARALLCLAMQCSSRDKDTFNRLLQDPAFTSKVEAIRQLALHPPENELIAQHQWFEMTRDKDNQLAMLMACMQPSSSSSSKA